MNRVFPWSIGALIAMALTVGTRHRGEKVPKKPGSGPGRAATSPGSGTLHTETVHAHSAAMLVAGAERIFVSAAAINNLAEIEASRFVAGRTTDAGLKSYARQMGREHARAADQLNRIATGKGIALPGSLIGETKSRLDRLKDLPAGEMERAYVADFGIAAHDRAIRLFESQVRDSTDPDLRAYAERTLPRLREHQIMARQLQEKAGM
ncbi:MAG: DUF4142 domain-containing protein [Bacteroidota bacterium]